ncbi:MraW methylase family-domain-containing protein [Syncephalis plumigaleata]|nr:MraW methylase family-domain-containing protein [Syncephalis plumigaleata]
MHSIAHSLLKSRMLSCRILSCTPILQRLQQPYIIIAKQHYCQNISTTSDNGTSSSFNHTPVLIDEVVDRLTPIDGGYYCDATFGAGGYTRRILDSADCHVMAIDRDTDSVERARELATQPAYKGRLTPVAGRFGDLLSIVQRETTITSTPCFNGIVFDIGVSSMQIDDPQRGFSYRWDGPLDMRMTASSSPSSLSTETAADLVNSMSVPDMEQLFFRFGGEQHARSIARSIAATRIKTPILRTTQLTELILNTVRGRTPDPYRCVARVFQSLRMQINDELGELRRGLQAAEQLLCPGGHLIVVTFHSLEDKLVKDFIYRCAGRRPIEGKSHERAQRKQRRNIKEDTSIHRNHLSQMIPTISNTDDDDDTSMYSFEIVKRKATRPTTQEVKVNRRSQSAKLRHAIRTHAPPLNPTI